MRLLLRRVGSARCRSKGCSRGYPRHPPLLDGCGLCRCLPPATGQSLCLGVYSLACHNSLAWCLAIERLAACLCVPAYDTLMLLVLCGGRCVVCACVLWCRVRAVLPRLCSTVHGPHYILVVPCRGGSGSMAVGAVAVWYGRTYVFQSAPSVMLGHVSSYLVRTVLGGATVHGIVSSYPYFCFE